MLPGGFSTTVVPPGVPSPIPAPGRADGAGFAAASLFGGNDDAEDVGGEQNMLRQMLHTKPVAMTRLWQKHAARKSTVDWVGPTMAGRASASLKPKRRYVRRPAASVSVGMERYVPPVKSAACWRKVVRPPSPLLLGGTSAAAATPFCSVAKGFGDGFRRSNEDLLSPRRARTSMTTLAWAAAKMAFIVEMYWSGEESETDITRILACIV